MQQKLQRIHTNTLIKLLNQVLFAKQPNVHVSFHFAFALNAELLIYRSVSFENMLKRTKSSVVHFLSYRVSLHIYRSFVITDAMQALQNLSDCLLVKLNECFSLRKK